MAKTSPLPGTDPHELRFAVLAADTVLLSLRDRKLCVRLIPVNRPPHFVHMQGLPGGLIGPKETADEAAARHIEAKAGVARSKLYVEQLYTFSRVDRDKRNRVVAVAHLALVPWDHLSDAERADAEGAAWTDLPDARKLAYDHDEMLALAVARLRSRSRYTTIISKLLPKEFTLTELESAYEQVLGERLDKRNFRKKVLKLGILKELKKKRAGGRFRPAQLYAFSSGAVREIEVL